MPKRKTKNYRRPKKAYDSLIIKEENALIKRYGLKNRREVWKADYAISKIRGIAKSLITADEKKKEEFIKRQQEKGFKVNGIADILGLNKEDYLKRRLQSLVVMKGITNNYKQARQFITHKHITIDNKRINCPSHLTTLSEEASIATNLALQNKKELTNEEKQFLKNIKHGKGSTEETKAEN